MSELTEDERATLHALHQMVVWSTDPMTCHVCSRDAEVVERIIDARTRAVKQERDEWIARFNAEYPERVERLIAEWKARAEAAEQRIVELEAAVLALADEWVRSAQRREDLGWNDGCTRDLRTRANELRALVPDPTALDRVRWNGKPWSACTGASDCPEQWHVHGCFADTGQCDDPIDHRENLDRVRQEAVEAALAPIEALDVTLDWYASDKPLISADQLRQALAAARDAAKEAGR